MNTEALLTLTQWLSPGFPVGAFAYSHGLERVIDRGDMRDAATLKEWLQDVVEYGGGQSDMVLLAAAYTADKTLIQEADATASAFAASSGRLTETRDQGAAFSRTVDNIWGTSLGSLCYPVAVGAAAFSRGIPLEPTAQIYLHAFAANLVSAAVRLVPLGQSDGQRVLAELAPLLAQIAAHAPHTTLDDLTSQAFASDIAAMQHETQYSKVFRT